MVYIETGVINTFNINQHQISNFNLNNNSTINNDNTENDNIESTNPFNNSVPRSIIILNTEDRMSLVPSSFATQPFPHSHFHDYNYDFDLDLDLDLDLDINVNDHTDSHFETNFTHVEEELNSSQSLHTSYNTNKLLIKNSNFLHSLSSITSTVDDSSTYSISRSNTPIHKCNTNTSNIHNNNIHHLALSSSPTCTNLKALKKRKIESNKDQNAIPDLFSFQNYAKIVCSNFNDNNDDTLIQYPFEFSSFTTDRLSLIKRLTLNESLDKCFINEMVLLILMENIDIKFSIMKQIIEMPSSLISIENTNLLKHWTLNITLPKIKQPDNYYIFYKTLMVDFFKMLSLLDSLTAFIFHKIPQQKLKNNEMLEREILSQFHDSLNSSIISEIQYHCNLTLKINEFDLSFLEKFVYILWKTEDSSICTHFRNLFG